MYAAIILILWFGGQMIQTGGMQVGELDGIPELCYADYEF